MGCADQCGSAREVLLAHTQPPTPVPPPAFPRGVAITEIRVEMVGRDALGSIVTLITSRGAVDALTAAAEIMNGHAVYTAGPDSWVRARVRAIPSITGLYLFANWDGTHRNNLHQLSPVRRATVARPKRLTLRGLRNLL